MFTEDLSVFFDTDDFAEDATYDTVNTIAVIFDRAYLEQLGMIASAEPTALTRAADVAADPTGKPLVIRGVTYTIRNILPQDDGAVVLLHLERAA
jgi:hypothetical protein